MQCNVVSIHTKHWALNLLGTNTSYVHKSQEGQQLSLARQLIPVSQDASSIVAILLCH